MKKTGRKPLLCKVKKRTEEGKIIEVWNTPIDNFFKGIKLGMSNVKASEFAGFTEAALYEWIAKGEADLDKGQDTIFVEFIETLKKNRAECQAFHLQNVIRAGQNGSWQASAWILERVFPSSFGQNRVDTIEEDKIEVVNDVPKQ